MNNTTSTSKHKKGSWSLVEVERIKNLTDDIEKKFGAALNDKDGAPWVTDHHNSDKSSSNWDCAALLAQEFDKPSSDDKETR
ncbi:hypothetical protein KCU92_g2955, partial [Aureobasidium melanogenum]|jgi:hypothetical protein